MNDTYANERPSGERTDDGRQWLPQPLLHVDRAREGDHEVVAARGEVDVSTVTVLSEAVRAAVHGDAERLVVDLCDVSFIDSTGLHVLLNALRRLTRQGRRLSVACRQDGQVHRTLSLAELVGTFSVHSTRNGALADADPLGPGLWRR